MVKAIIFVAETTKNKQMKTVFSVSGIARQIDRKPTRHQLTMLMLNQNSLGAKPYVDKKQLEQMKRVADKEYKNFVAFLDNEIGKLK